MRPQLFYGAPALTLVAIVMACSDRSILIGILTRARPTAPTAVASGRATARTLIPAAGAALNVRPCPSHDNYLEHRVDPSQMRGFTIGGRALV